MMLIDDSQQVLQCAVAINPIVNFGFHCEWHLDVETIYCNPTYVHPFLQIPSSRSVTSR